MHTPEHILKKYWGYSHFRPLQREIIASVLNGNDAIAVMPTGGGKSLCYQLPALIKDGFCLVVSPLIALMQDQVARLKQRDILAACIHSGMQYEEVQQTLNSLLHGPYKLLYVSPERLQTTLFQEYLSEFNINLLAVDEAHCISQWGYDFRPDYLKIAEIKSLLPPIPTIALTASGTPSIVHDIEAKLQLNSVKIFITSIKRENIFYEVKYTEQKKEETLKALSQASSSIIYCRSRKQTELLARHINQQGKQALHYHAGMNKDKRTEAQLRWMNNEASIMVATTAFGMGIDKPDVDLVIQYDAPEHLEAYYQEAGRAGRDGRQAKALTLYNTLDINRLTQSIDLQFPKEGYLRQIYQSVTEYLQIPIGTEPNKYYPFDLSDFCKRFNLNAPTTSYALRLLAQEGLWTLTEAVFHPAAIQITSDRHVIDGLAKAFPTLHYIIIGLLRQYGNIFYYPVTVRLSALAKQLRMRAEEIDKALMQLHYMQVISYSKPGEGPQLFFHHYRVDSNHLIIDYQRINTLRKYHQERTDAMIGFLQNQTHCRERLLKLYFGEQVNEDCGHCDICLKKKPQSMHTEKDIRIKIIELISAIQQPVTVNQITAAFPSVIQEHLLTTLRRLIDEKQLVLNTDGTVSKA